MAEHVEARSLASLNYLAANPPQYPKKPTDERQDPVTLYISRVPGTRDVILSTLKPQLKNVTAEDVASSLYYVHLSAPEEEPLDPPHRPGGRSASPSSTEESSPVSATQIQRKPLPSQPGPVMPHTRDRSASLPSGKENTGYESLARRPVNAQEQPATSQSLKPLLKGPVARKPLGPRLPASEHTQNDAPAVPSHTQLPTRESPAADEHAPSLPTRPRGEPFPLVLPPEPSEPQVPSHYTHASASLAPPPIDTSHLTSSSKRRPFKPFCLTLIRRDPTSGQQWNVGKVASFQLENPELILNDERYRQPSPSVNIHLETSGYAKFRGMPTKQSLDTRPSSASSASKLQVPEKKHSHVPASGAFERHVAMTYSPSFAANLRQRFRRRSSVDGDEEGRHHRHLQTTSPYARPQHRRDGSAASIGSFGGDFDGSEPPVITQPAQGLKPRGYVFQSPWDGRCEFVTGNAGRSLQCRHVLPSYGGGVFNPLVHDGSEGGGEHGEDRARNNALPVSELRFNLPSSELFGGEKSSSNNNRPADGGGGGGARARDQLQSGLSRMLARAQQGFGESNNLSDDGEDYCAPLDLSLGRERAGGGNRGRRAKMGKLIVFDEGLKMLDLVVAANVGIWWITWERTFE